jgi:hypothetical protein
MLREQVFPIDQNDASLLTDNSDAYCWWNLAARHGGGSANELRYPLGVRPGSTTTRKLYFAEAKWGDDTFDGIPDNGTSFNYITGDGPAKSSETATDGWVYPKDPTELRLLLISTTNPDLSLPDKLDSDDQFNAFWNDWAVGSDGNPAAGSWNSYGLGNDWEGRAAELNIERIDLRDWLCTVSVEIRKRINLSTLESFPFDENSTSTELRRVVLENTSGGSVYVARSEDTDTDSTTYTIESIVIDGAPVAEIQFTEGGYSEKVPQLVLKSDTVEIEKYDLDLVAPRNTTLGFEDSSNVIQLRYFLLNETIPLKDESGQDVGRFILTEPFSSLRFDGLQWQY